MKYLAKYCLLLGILLCFVGLYALVTIFNETHQINIAAVVGIFGLFGLGALFAWAGLKHGALK
jgi:hypothetical protein